MRACEKKNEIRLPLTITVTAAILFVLQYIRRRVQTHTDFVVVSGKCMYSKYPVVNLLCQSLKKIQSNKKSNADVSNCD